MSDELSKPRRVSHVDWIINAIYNKQWRRTINTNRLHTLGDMLDAEKLLNVSPSWDGIKRGSMNSKELYTELKNKSLRTFATRDIFMKWIKSNDERGLLISLSYSLYSGILLMFKIFRINF